MAQLLPEHMMATLYDNSLFLTHQFPEDEEHPSIVFDSQPASDLSVLAWPEQFKTALLHRFTMPLIEQVAESYQMLHARQNVVKLELMGKLYGARVDTKDFRSVADATRKSEVDTRAKSRLNAIFNGIAIVAFLLAAPLISILFENLVFGVSWSLLLAFLILLTVVVIGGAWVLWAIWCEKPPEVVPWWFFSYVPMGLFAWALVPDHAHSGLGWELSLSVGPSGLVFVVVMGLAYVLKRLLIPLIAERHLVGHLLLAHSLYEAAVAVVEGPEDSASKAIERAAIVAEKELRRLGPARDQTLRPWAIRLSQKVAATIRQHRIVLAIPATTKQELVQSLINGMRIAQDGRLQALALHDPAPALPTALRKWGARVALAAVLICLAVLSPYIIPHLDGSGQLNSLRLGLVVTATFALFAPNTGRVHDRIQNFLTEASKHKG